MLLEDLYQLFKESHGVSIDSRTITPGDLFFAIQGERFDGNAFAQDALERGARKAIVSDPSLKGDDVVLVHNPLELLQQLATLHRQQFQGPVIGITGSNGKTTTKELVSAALSAKFRVYATPGNLNNHIGVPLTILKMPMDTDIAVIEMGANHIGEIAFLCTISQPNAGLITNVGRAHLEGFGSVEGVRQGKSELYRYLQDRGGLIFIHGNDPGLMGLKPIDRHDIIYWTQPDTSEKKGFVYSILPDTGRYGAVQFTDSDGNIKTLRSPVFGKYNLLNICCALTIGRHYGVPSGPLINAIEKYVPVANRSEIKVIGSNTFYLDAYNANPDSMHGSVRSFAQTEHARKALILGEMRELGAQSADEHRRVLEALNPEDWSCIILVGEAFKSLASAGDGRIIYFDHVDALIPWFKRKKFDGIAFLLKGSRAIQLEKLCHAL